MPPTSRASASLAHRGVDLVAGGVGGAVLSRHLGPQGARGARLSSSCGAPGGPTTMAAASADARRGMASGPIISWPAR